MVNKDEYKTYPVLWGTTWPQPNCNTGLTCVTLKDNLNLHRNVLGLSAKSNRFFLCLCAIFPPHFVKIGWVVVHNPANKHT